MAIAIYYANKSDDQPAGIVKWLKFGENYSQ